MKHFYLALGMSILLGVGGCASSDKKDGVPAGPSNVTFFDSSIFDENLETGLKNSPDELIVNVPSRFDLNQIPSRVERWLAAAKEKGGEISVKRSAEGGASRGFLLDAVDLVIRAYDSITEDDLYDSIEGYDGRIVYDADGKVEKIIFVKKS